MPSRFHDVQNLKGWCFNRKISLSGKTTLHAKSEVLAHQSLIAHHITKANGSNKVHSLSFLLTFYKPCKTV